jgi:transposase
MGDPEQWKKRVEAWRSSGLSAAEYCKGQEFTAGTLYRWSSRLAQAGGGEAVHAVPLARVVRETKLAPAVPGQLTPCARAVIIEVHGARVWVPSGADVATVTVVLEALRAGGRSVAR